MLLFCTGGLKCMRVFFWEPEQTQKRRVKSSLLSYLLGAANVPAEITRQAEGIIAQDMDNVEWICYGLLPTYVPGEEKQAAAGMWPPPLLAMHLTRCRRHSCVVASAADLNN